MDRDFAGYAYPQRIAVCNRNVSHSRRVKICALYKVYDRTNYTVDHIIPLFAGGSNHDANLWCQHKRIYTGHIERWMYDRLRRNEITQAEVVRYMLAHKFNPSGKDRIPTPPRP